MIALLLDPEAPPESISWNPPLTDDEFEALAMANDFFLLERTKEGEILVTPATGDDTGISNTVQRVEVFLPGRQLEELLGRRGGALRSGFRRLFVAGLQHFLPFSVQPLP